MPNVKPPKPTVLRIAEGVRDKKKVNKKEPAPRLKIPPMPNGMSADAKKEWKRIAPILLENGLLTEMDSLALELYCESYSMYRKASQKLKQQGVFIKGKNGGQVYNQWYSVQQKAQTALNKYLAEFGFSPAQRTRLSSENDMGSKKKDNPFDDV